MWSDIISLTLSVIGIVSLLFSTIILITSWQTDSFTITLPLKKADRKIYRQIYNLRSLLDFCGLKEKCTIVIINYDAPDWFCNDILSYYEKYGFLKIISYPERESDIF